MNSNKFTLPKKYSVFFAAFIFFAVISFVNIFVFDYLTGVKEFSVYDASDIVLNLIFLGTELLYFAMMAFFAKKCGKMVKEKTLMQRNNWYDAMYTGIKLDNYNYVWFDFEDEQRDLILKNGVSWQVYVEKYNDKLEIWEAVNTVSVYDSLTALKKALYSDFDFYCSENVTFDEHGDYEYEKNSFDTSLNKYEISDLWLLLSIGFSKNGSTLSSIIRYSYYLNHAIFTLDELNYSMSKLIYNGYVKKINEYFIATKKARSFYKTTKMFLFSQ